jgi:hypothetical protein
MTEFAWFLQAYSPGIGSPDSVRTRASGSVRSPRAVPSGGWRSDPLARDLVLGSRLEQRPEARGALTDELDHVSRSNCGASLRRAMMIFSTGMWRSPSGITAWKAVIA